MRAVDLFAGAGGCSTGLLQAATKRGERVAWAAGLIEGEGSIQVIKGRRSRYDGRDMFSFQLRVVMTDRDVLERLRDVFGVGTVSAYRNTQGLGKKQLYRWDIRRAELVREACRAIYPYMGERRRAQIDHVFAVMDANPLTSNSDRVRRRWATIRARASA